MSRRPLLPAVLAAAAVVVIVVGAAWLHAAGTHDDTSQPRADAPSSTSSPTGSATSGKLPASSKLPASGVCGRASGSVLTVRLEPDAPDPVCTSVGPGQSLRVVNSTGDFGAQAHPVTVSWIPGRRFTLAAGQSKAFPASFGSYLARGVHDLSVTSEAGYRAEIWLR